MEAIVDRRVRAVLRWASVATGENAARVACGSFQPIQWAHADTDETLHQVRQHNAAYVALCR